MSGGHSQSDIADAVAPLRFAFVTELYFPNVGGQEVFFQELAQAMVRRGHSVDVYCIGHQAGLADEEVINGIRVYRCQGSGGYRPDAMTVEAAMTGGLGLQPASPLNLGPQPEQSFDLDRPLREARDAFEKSYFEFHLARENGSMTRVAEKTGLERTHLYRKLKQLGVDLSRGKRGAGL